MFLWGEVSSLYVVLVASFVISGSAQRSAIQFPGSKSNDLLPQVCGHHLLRSRIIGGTEAERDAYGWTAALGYRQSGTDGVEYLCGAVLISARYALTAAQCFSTPRRPTEVLLGAWDLSGERDCVGSRCLPPLAAGIEEAIVHPDYLGDSNHFNDIALIRLNVTVEFNTERSIQPICLPASDLGKQSYAITTGWEGQVPEPRSTMRFLEIASVDEETCRSLYETRFGGNQLCMEGGSRCLLGGSPLFIPTNGGSQMNLIGLLSFGAFPCGIQGKPDVYTSVSQYRSWIQSNMRP